MLKTKKEKAYIVGIALALIAVIVVVLSGVLAPKKTPAPSAPEQTGSVVAAAEAHGLISEAETVSYETVREGLTELGFLVTEEYYFTEVVTDSKVLELLHTGIPLPFTESSYVGSYDGVVSAGVDFSAITAETSSVNGKTQLTITLPKPEIRSVDIDPDSFVLYSEKNGVANPFSVSEFNDALAGLEVQVKARALDKGILDRAEAHAVLLAEQMAGSLLPDADYALEILVK